MMTPYKIELKNYQKNALERLTQFLSECQLAGPADAFAKFADDKIKIPYKSRGFGDIPFVCLRLPTGGGKTLLAAHTVGIAAQHFIGTDSPLVLWLVPTTAIKDQTLDALKQPRHPYYQALKESLKGNQGQNPMVISMDDIIDIRPTDLENKAVIVIGTFATSRVQDTSIRKFYAHHENFEPHFARMPNGTPYMERFEDGHPNAGKVKYSFANLCHAKKPLVIVDEAHNSRTPLSLKTLASVNPSCVIEFTATPNQTKDSGSNVLFSVSASELHAEEMIKLPIMLSEHKNWESAVYDAVQTQKRLLELASKEKDYVRPIALFQAENTGKEVTVEVLKQHLIENVNIAAEKIAVATGTQRELDKVNLFDKACPIEYVITKQALKEGWDCSFAYVFCSVANISSDKDVEQLLGRVLRMPYAKRRFVEQLNCAYAHVTSPSFSRAASQLKDKLVDMGFEELEVARNLQSYDQDLFFFQYNQDDTQNAQTTKIKEKPLVLEITKPITQSDLPDSIASRSSISVDENGSANLIIHGEITEADNTAIVALYKKTQDSKTVKTASETIKEYILRQEAQKAPSENGLPFKIPNLCVAMQGDLFPPDREDFLEIADWDLISIKNGHVITEHEFKIEEQADSFKIDIEGRQIKYEAVRHEENLFDLNQVSTSLTEIDLIRFLDFHITAQDVVQPKKQEFFRRAISYLTDIRGISFEALVRSRFILVRVLTLKIEEARKKAAIKGFNLSLFGSEDIVSVSIENAFSFGQMYEVRNPYKGGFKFSKHYYPMIDDLKPSGEEFDCAQAIDRLDEVQYWVRNIIRSQFSFRFPTSTDYFYPDFVAKLKDGRTLVVEYKGEHLIENSDTKEKRMVGELWQRKSNDTGVFCMVQKRNSQGQDIYEQLRSAVI
ncbi:MAG: DEAD/DEAH box helicase family protein [Desulfamplus sp.]|nr:DEAD/DEAH box helicase family protein [Desulfamplus sp.]